VSIFVAGASFFWRHFLIGGASFRLVAAYASSANISASAFRLVTSEGDRMSGDKTLAHYGLQDGDQVDVVIEQTGGCM
jgi:hypothetical protein